MVTQLPIKQMINSGQHKCEILYIHTLQSRDSHGYLEGNKHRYNNIMAINSGQPGGLQPCRFPILQSINYFIHMLQNVPIRYQRKIHILWTCDPYTAPADVFIALKLAKSLPDLWDIEIFTFTSHWIENNRYCKPQNYLSHNLCCC